MLKPDLSTASLHFINTFEPSPHDLRNVIFDDYNICEDAVVSLWLRDSPFQSGVYTGLTSARFANIISQGGPAAKMLLPDIGHVYRPYPCPASGRFVLLDASDSVTVYDFF
jgi:hypothetical protein